VAGEYRLATGEGGRGMGVIRNSSRLYAGSITGKRNVVAWNVGKVNRVQAEGHPCDLMLL
jgi:hypothetical protein